MIKKSVKITRSLLFLSLVIIPLKGKFSDIKIYSNTQAFDRWILADKEHKFWDPYYNGEYNVAFNLIKNGDIFFDVGANFGTYTNTFLKKLRDLIIYDFEPVPLVFLFLKKNIEELGLDDHLTLLNHWGTFIKNLGQANINQINKNIFSKIKLTGSNNNTIFLLNQAVSDIEGPAIFNFHYSRPATGGLKKIQPSEVKLPEIMVEKITIDLFCQRNNIPKINFLKIDTEGHDYQVLKGAEQMLQHQKIDFIQFEYIARCKSAGWNLEKAYNYLTSLNYTLFKIVADGIVLIDEWRSSLENYTYANFLAVSGKIYKS